ncbi:MAG: DNA repair protein RadA [Cyclobacteriaceae bacterium]|nr:DNA repair protein RadA [Cyclobacteriaceae bacterium]
MAKKKTAFFCQNCGSQSPKWLGKCPACGEWNTYVEEVLQTEPTPEWAATANKDKRATRPVLLKEIKGTELLRLPSGDAELDRVLGGGIVPGSLVLIGGEPGIGKSTLMLQVAMELNYKVLYVSGEESEQQIKMRADRMTGAGQQCYILNETSLSAIFRQINEINPDMLVIDSIQTLHSDLAESSPGSVSQVRQCTGEILKFAKETHIPVFIIGHITKDGMIAGPKILEHMVDTVIQFEGDRHLSYRLLRTTKNRFGSTSELGIYEMTSYGLRQVSNPSEILISQREGELSGISIAATLEGNRTLLIEVQSLVSTAAYGTAQRSSTGFDGRRLNMLLAVLEKRTGFRMGNQDVFLNIAGGIRIDDPAADLAVCASVISSHQEIPVHEKICFAAEVGLGGEIRAVNRIENRITEAEKLGFDAIYISQFNKGLDSGKYKIKVRKFGRLDEVFSDLMG